MNKTSQLIHRLAQDSVGVKRQTADSPAFFGMKVLFWGSFILAAAMAWLTFRNDIASASQVPHIVAETLLWGLAGGACAKAAYDSAIPGSEISVSAKISVALLMILTLSVVTRGVMHEGFGVLAVEEDLYRGRCGPLIILIGMVSAGALTYSLRRMAPTRSGLTGTWIALASACLGGFAMQLVCRWDNPLHMIVWHLLPVLLLATTGAWAGRRYLRW